MGIPPIGSNDGDQFEPQDVKDSCCDDKTIAAIVAGIVLGGFVGLILHKRRKKDGSIDLSTEAPPLQKRKITIQTKDLKLTRNEQRDISELINTLGDCCSKGKFFALPALAYNTPKLKQLEDRIKNVHPLIFLGYICAKKSVIKKHLPTILQLHLTKVEFVKNLKNNIQKELSKNNLTPHIPALAKKVGKEEKKILAYIEENEIEKLIRYVGNA